MGKSIKLKNNNYWDSKGVDYKHTNLEVTLDNILATLSNMSSKLSLITNNGLQRANSFFAFRTKSDANLNTAHYLDGLTYHYNAINAPNGANGFILQFSWEFSSEAPNAYGCQFWWAYNSNRLFFRSFYEGNYTSWKEL